VQASVLFTRSFASTTSRIPHLSRVYVELNFNKFQKYKIIHNLRNILKCVYRIGCLGHLVILNLNKNHNLFPKIVYQEDLFYIYCIFYNAWFERNRRFIYPKRFLDILCFNIDIGKTVFLRCLPKRNRFCLYFFFTFRRLGETVRDGWTDIISIYGMAAGSNGHWNLRNNFCLRCSFAVNVSKILDSHSCLIIDLLDIIYRLIVNKNNA
jgi:hypothetical protein